VGRVTARPCSEWQGILAMDAIGGASVEEARQLQEHLDHCDQCRRDAEDVRSAAGALKLLDATQVDRLERELTVLALPVLDGGERGFSDSAAGSTGMIAAPTPEGASTEAAGLQAAGRKRRWMVAVTAVAAVAAAVVAAVVLGTTTPPPTKTVALTGQKGVVASVSLAEQSWGTRATLRESGQVAGQVLTVSMRTSSGRSWVAGSYRTTARLGTVVVQLSCAVNADQIAAVWVSDQVGQTVLNGYVG
jgi:hypothetical protein